MHASTCRFRLTGDYVPHKNEEGIGPEKSNKSLHVLQLKVDDTPTATLSFDAMEKT